MSLFSPCRFSLPSLPWPGIAAATAYAMLSALPAAAAEQEETPGDTPRPPNVLFLVADDLRASPGRGLVDTPAIDGLAATGLRFEHAYCQIPSCGPSRASFLTGRRPDATGVFDNRTTFRDRLPDATTLPQHFRGHGYRTLSLGKVFHGKFSQEINDDPPSWSEPPWRPVATQYQEPESIAILRQRYPKAFEGGDPVAEILAQRRYKGPAWEAPDVGDEDLTDGRTARRAVQMLGELAQGGEPFFLAVGFVKPHAPFVAPKRYFDRVRREKVGPPELRRLPEGAPELASTSREMHGYHGVPGAKEGVFPEHKTVELITAYQACVSYIDAQIGKVIGALDRHGLAENTVVVFTSDHGYHLGEAGQWSKNTNFEEALRVPLIVRSPRHPDAAGRSTGALVELVDLHPSLSELCGLPALKEAEGTSFAPLLDNPDFPWKEVAFSQHSADFRDPAAPVGRTVRTATHRYVQWRTPEGEVLAEELYGMESGATPDRNLAGNPEYGAVLGKMRSLLAQGWRRARK